MEIEHIALTPHVRVQNGGATAVPTIGGRTTLFDPAFVGAGAFSSPLVPTGPPTVYSIQAVFPSEGEMRQRVAEAEMTTRLAVATDFARRAHDVPGIREIRANAAERELFVTALTEDRDMERDLRLQALFAEVSAAHSGDAFLRVRVFDRSHADEYGPLLQQ